MGANGTATPLEGLVVLDLSRVLTGPYAAMVMGDLGARIIKVERPGLGDETRSWGPPFVGSDDSRFSTYFLAVNRNKESVALDFDDSDDRQVLEALVRRADVLVENFRPGVLERAGLSHDKLHELNPRLVVVSITGFGPDGPDSDRAGYDQIIQGEAGLMSLTGADADDPTKVGIPVADLSAGLFGVIGALSALHDVARTGRGAVVSTSLLASVVALHTFQGTRWLVGGEVPFATGNAHPTVRPYGGYRTGDGRLLQIAVGNEQLWKRFAAALDIDADDSRFATNEQRFAHTDELDEVISASLAQQPLDAWLTSLAEAGVPAGEVKSLDQVYEDPQVLSQGLVIEVEDPTLGRLRLPGPATRVGREATTRAHRAPPRLDEHGKSVREWLAETP